MKKTIHILSNADIASRTAVCSICGPIRLRACTNKSGTISYLCSKRKTKKNWVHILSNIDEENRSADCAKCGKGIRINRGPISRGSYWKCASPRTRYTVRNGKTYSYRKHINDVCEECGFVCKELCQMDIHHIDGNHKNNDPTNLKTVCANCHRLISRQEAIDRFEKKQWEELYWEYVTC